jgi:hypothetical protein
VRLPIRNLTLRPAVPRGLTARALKRRRSSAGDAFVRHRSYFFKRSIFQNWLLDHSKRERLNHRHTLRVFREGNSKKSSTLCTCPFD